MQSENCFRLKDMTFGSRFDPDFQISLVAEESVDSADTHFTLLMGANGTNKSRILASCADLFRSPRSRRSVAHRSLQSYDELICKPNSEGEQANQSYPSRVLAISNLVRDRFTFDYVSEDSTFYYYLGVRRATNSTTTGALESLVVDCFYEFLRHPDKAPKFQEWLTGVFPPLTLELRILTNDRRIDAFLKEPKEFVSRHFKDRPPFTSFIDKFEKLEKEVVKFMKFLQSLPQCWPEKTRYFVGLRDFQRDPVSDNFLVILKACIRMRLVDRPMVIASSGMDIPFSSLSSGEQNLISTGARLVAYATPRSLVLIDEPEISLNVAWQQRYIEIIEAALANAAGSHVLIASHSPYLVADLKLKNSTIVLLERTEEGLTARSTPGEFWGWGVESILFDVLKIPSASNYFLSRELAHVLQLVKKQSQDSQTIRQFLDKVDVLDFSKSAQPLQKVFDEIRRYYERISS